MNTMRLSQMEALVLVLATFVLLIPIRTQAHSLVPLQPVSDTAIVPVARPFDPTASPITSTVLTTGTTEVLIKFEKGLDPRTVTQIHARLQGIPVAQIPILDVQVVRVPVERAKEVLDAYNRTPGVVYAEPNYRVQAFFIPNDPLFPEQWNLQAIHAPEAWDLSCGDSATIAIVDTGVRPNHPDLRDKLVAGYDFVNNDNEPWDDNGHGTIVALVAAATPNNRVGIAGVGCNAKVMPVKALNALGSGTHSWVASAIVWAASHGADVINLSLGGPFSSRTLSEAVEYAWNQGVVLVAAAGNEGSGTMTYPAAYPAVMAATAVTSERERLPFSNHGQYISVAAPGAGIITESSGVVSWAGTSLAAAHVAGVAALVASYDLSLQNARVRTIIEQTADDLGEPGWDPYFGHGLINAYRAVLATASPEAAIKPREAMVQAINGLRRTHNLPALRSTARLMGLAQRRIETLVARCTGISDPGVLRHCLDEGASVGNDEILVIGTDTVEETVQMLLNLSEGPPLILGPYWELGVGMVVADGNARLRVWLLRFGRGRIGAGSSPLANLLSDSRLPVVGGP